MRYTKRCRSGKGRPAAPGGKARSQRNEHIPTEAEEGLVEGRAGRRQEEENWPQLERDVWKKAEVTKVYGGICCTEQRMRDPDYSSLKPT